MTMIMMTEITINNIATKITINNLQIFSVGNMELGKTQKYGQSPCENCQKVRF